MNRWKKQQQQKPLRSNVAKRPKLSGDRAGGSFGYFISRALSNIKQNVFVNVVTIGTITLALLILSLFLLLFVNLENSAESWSDKIQVTTYFDRDLSNDEQLALKKRISSLNAVSKVNFVSKEDAMKRFRSRLRGQETLLDGVRSDILPTSFEISLKRSKRDSVSIDAFVKELKNINGITEVQYGEEWVKRFNSFLNFMRITGALLGIFLIVAVIFIVSNTIKLTIYARKDELEIMSLVGATRFFIKAPFLIEGIIQGGIGALIAITLLFGIYEGFLHNAGSFISFNPAVSGLSFLPFEYLIAIIVAGKFLGFMGSLTSLKRFISV